jgi:hypothetical protein
MYANIVDNQIEIANTKEGVYSFLLDRKEDAPYCFINDNGIIELDNSKQEKEQLAAEWKANRELLVSQIEVEYNGHIFQGDETSQDRMSRALAVLPDDMNTTWRTSDNQNVSISKDDLKEILFLAGQEQTRIWFEDEPTTQGETA